MPRRLIAARGRSSVAARVRPPNGWLLRAGILALWGMTLGLGVVVFEVPPASDAHRFALGIALWSWIFGASGCVRILALSATGRGMSLPILRMACAVVGLFSWSQLAWLLLQTAAGTFGAATGGIGVSAVVALSELHAIYRAAHDARSDDT